MLSLGDAPSLLLRSDDVVSFELEEVDDDVLSLLVEPGSCLCVVAPAPIRRVSRCLFS